MAQLVIRAQGGDRDAMGELFNRYRQHVFAIALRRLGDENEAQELCQEVFLQAIQKLDQLRDPECFAGWLRSIAQRMAINRALRRPPSVATEPQTLEATCVDPRTPYKAVIENERSDQVRWGLRRAGEFLGIVLLIRVYDASQARAIGQFATFGFSRHEDQS